MSSAPLFASVRYCGREIDSAESPRIQALFDANPGYFVAVDGRPAGPNEAADEFREVPPAHFGYTRQWFAGLFDRADALVGFTIVVSDLCAAGVWHIAFFMIDSRLQGTGAAAEIYAALEDWIRRSGATWLRLGVVEGNDRARRFWEKQGYRQVRVRSGANAEGRMMDTRVFIKPLAGASLAEYLARVPSDRPDSTLP